MLEKVIQGRLMIARRLLRFVYGNPDWIQVSQFHKKAVATTQATLVKYH